MVYGNFMFLGYLDNAEELAKFVSNDKAQTAFCGLRHYFLDLTNGSVLAVDNKSAAIIFDSV